MASTPARPLRVSDDLIERAAAAAAVAGYPDAEFSVLARAGLALIAEHGIPASELVAALQLAELPAGWPRKEART